MLKPRGLHLTAALMVVLQAFSAVFPDPLCWSNPLHRDDHIIRRPCFERLCHCSSFTADCSSNLGKLTLVPRLPSSVQVLNFSNNELTTIDDDHFFANLTTGHVWLLDLYNNRLTYIAQGAVQSLVRITTFLLGGNRLSNDTLLNILQLPNLIKLDLKCGDFISIGDTFYSSPKSKIEYLDLSQNSLETFDLHKVQPLKSLSELKVAKNMLSILTTAYMPSLQYLALDRNRLYEFPRTCNDSGQSFFPKLIELNLQFNMISAIEDPVCLPTLSTLKMEFNQFRFFTSGTFTTSRFPSLTHLHLSEMSTRVHRIDAFAFNNSVLQDIGMGHNEIDFLSAVNDSAFEGCPNLWKLYLDFSNFRFISDDKFRRLFQPLESLRTLYMGKSQLAQIARNTFSVLQNVEELYLYGNFITFVPDGAFDAMLKLKVLGLGENSITVITSNTFSDTTRQRERLNGYGCACFPQIDRDPSLDRQTVRSPALSLPSTQSPAHRLRALSLDGNPFECSCDIVWFQQWLTTQPSLFRHYPGQDYLCHNLKHTRIVEFFIQPQACLMDRTTSILTIAGINIFLVLFIVFSLLFRFRWHLRLLLYEVCRERQRRRRQGREARQFQYDVFVAYAEQDLDWVLHELIPVMEAQWGLRLCIHQRDFMPGEHIVDNISDSVNNSYRLLMVFSPHFARSEWCQFELKFCQVSAMQRDDVLLIVLLQETESRDLTAAMLAVMKTTTYIDWSDEEDARQAFWGRLQMALPD